MINQLLSAFATLLLLVLTLGCERASDQLPMSEDMRGEIVAAATALDRTWSQAAARSDVAGAMACFRPVENFSFAYDGGLCSSFEDFHDLVRRSYGDRVGFEATTVERQVTVVSRDTAVVACRSRSTVTGKDGSSSQIEVIYGFVCTKQADEWRIVHAYEFTVG